MAEINLDDYEPVTKSTSVPQGYEPVDLNEYESVTPKAVERTSTAAPYETESGIFPFLRNVKKRIVEERNPVLGPAAAAMVPGTPGEAIVQGGMTLAGPLSAPLRAIGKVAPAVGRVLMGAGSGALGAAVEGKDITTGAAGPAAIQTALETIPRSIGGIGRTLGRVMPGSWVPLQEVAAQRLRQTVGSFPAPSASPIYKTLEATEMLHPTQIPTSVPGKVDLPAKVAALAKQLTPLIRDWKLGINPRLQGSARALETALQSGGNNLTLSEAKSLMESLGPQVQRAAGPSGGAIKSLWSETRKAVEAAAEAGVPQAQTLLEAQAVHKRFEAVAGTAQGRELPSLQDILRKGIKPVEYPKLPEQVNAAEIQNLLRRPDIRDRLLATLKPEESAALQSAVTSASKAPRHGEYSDFIERLLPYLLLTSGGVASGYGAGGGSAALGGGAAGVLAAESATRVLRQFASSPQGGAVIRRLFENRLGSRGASSAATALAPVVTRQLQPRQKP